VRRAALSSLALLWAAGAFAAPAEVVPLDVKQDVAPAEVRLGEPFVRTVSISHPAEQRWELRRSTDTGPLEVLELQRRRVDGPRVATTTFTLRLSAFELGALQLPPLQFDVATADGEQAWTSEPGTVTVVGTLPPDAEEKGAGFYDIRPPETVPVPSYTLLYVLAGLLAAALLAWLLYRWWKRPRPDRALRAPLLPLEVRTRQALDALGAEDLPRQGRVKEFYIRLTEILRGYVGERYGVEALECTSSELVDRLRDVHDDALPREDLTTLLFEADLVKFARAERSPEECQQALQFGYQLLAATTPRPTAPADAPQRQLP
jgi:hypothetical protein